VRGSYAIGAAVVVGLWSLACGGGTTPVEGDPVVIDVPTPDPVVVAPTPAPAPAPAAPRCPEGVHAAPLWQGEYPGPVVNVTKEFTTPARAAACDGEPKGPCTVAVGIYHPWANTAARFATLRPIDKFRLNGPWTAQTDIGKTLSLTAGDEVEITAYYGEGYCGYRAGGSEFAAMCPDMLTTADDKPLFEAVSAIEFADIQVLGVDCREGHAGWIDVNDALFALAEVEEGEVIEYGSVGPAQK